MALTENLRRFKLIAGGKAKDVKNGLADPAKRTAIIEGGRTAVAESAAFVTDAAATARAVAGQGWSKATRTVEDIMTPPPVWDNDSKKAKLYAAATSAREQARVAKNKGLSLVQEHGPKVAAPARRLGSKVVTTTQTKTPVAKSFASRHRDELLLALAVGNVIFLSRRIIARRRGNKK